MIYLNLLIVIIGVNLVMMFMYNKDNCGGYGKVVRLPKLYLWIGIAGTSFNVAMMLLMTFSSIMPPELWGYVGFSAFGLVSSAFILAYLNWFIILEKDHFLYRSMFRKIYKVLYTEVIDCKISDMGVTIKTKFRTFEVDRNLPGVRELGQRLRSQTRKNSK